MLYISGMIRLLLTLIWLIPAAAAAGPENYRLDTEGSSVRFTYSLDGAQKSGRMPIQSADLFLDLDHLPASRVLVTLNADGARAGFIIATEAMKGRNVLNTGQFPEIHFRSTRIEGDRQNADVSGDLTIRGVTRPTTLKARLFRQRGTDLYDRNNLLVELTGTIRRSDFGANGYPNLVGDMITLQIMAQITR